MLTILSAQPSSVLLQTASSCKANPGSLHPMLSLWLIIPPPANGMYSIFCDYLISLRFCTHCNRILLWRNVSHFKATYYLTIYTQFIYTQSISTNTDRQTSLSLSLSLSFHTNIHTHSLSPHTETHTHTPPHTTHSNLSTNVIMHSPDSHILYIYSYWISISVYRIQSLYIYISIWIKMTVYRYIPVSIDIIDTISIWYISICQGGPSKMSQTG